MTYNFLLYYREKRKYKYILDFSKKIFLRKSGKWQTNLKKAKQVLAKD